MRSARGDSTRLDSARYRRLRLRLRLLGSPRLSPSPPRCMYAFYAACTALDAFLSRAAINRRNIEVEAPASTVRARPRETSRAVRQPISPPRERDTNRQKREITRRGSPRREREERKKRERGERERDRHRGWRRRRDRAVIKIERYIDDFSDALPRIRRSPLLSLGRVGKSAIPKNPCRSRGSQERIRRRKEETTNRLLG